MRLTEKAGHSLYVPDRGKISRFRLWREKVVEFVTALVEKFSADRTMTLAASLAFYTILSLAPLSVLILFAFSQLDGALVDRFIREANGLVGYSGGSAIELAIRSARDRPLAGGLASLVSLTVILVSAGAMFGELRESLAIILRSGAPPAKDESFVTATWQLIRAKLLSIGFALTFVLILAISLVISAFLSAIAESLGLLYVELPISFTIYAGIFSLLLMYGTYRGLGWRDASRGGMITAALFILGKVGIGLYIGNGSVASAYGAAGSVVVLLIWIFYASLIVFTGAQAAWLLSSRNKATARPSLVLSPGEKK